MFYFNNFYKDICFSVCYVRKLLLCQIPTISAIRPTSIVFFPVASDRGAFLHAVERFRSTSVRFLQGINRFKILAATDLQGVKRLKIRF